MSRNPNRMAEAISVLTQRFQTSASELITYTQKSTGTVVSGILATRGRSIYQVDQDGVFVPYESDDFIISCGALSFTPTSGDVVTDAGGHTYLVSVPGKFNVYESFQGISYKIHTKAVT